MPDVAKLKKKAAELELKKQFDKALAVYVEILDSYEGSREEVDVTLYNRVGDIHLKQGNVADAVEFYERAVDHYVDTGFYNNAIALCNKILRSSPGRNSIYYKLGKISAHKGFKGDAKANFLEYADRMQKSGKLNEAFRALKEFADLCPDQDDIRLMLAEQLHKAKRGEEAIEQLQLAYERYVQEGRTAEAQAAVARMKAIDRSVEPREPGSAPKRNTGDLVFLDLNDAPPRTTGAHAAQDGLVFIPTEAPPPAAAAPPAPPAAPPPRAAPPEPEPLDVMPMEPAVLDGLSRGGYEQLDDAPRAGLLDGLQTTASDADAGFADAGSLLDIDTIDFGSPESNVSPLGGADNGMIDLDLMTGELGGSEQAPSGRAPIDDLPMLDDLDAASDDRAPSGGDLDLIMPDEVSFDRGSSGAGSVADDIPLMDFGVDPTPAPAPVRRPTPATARQPTPAAPREPVRAAPPPPRAPEPAAPSASADDAFEVHTEPVLEAPSAGGDARASRSNAIVDAPVGEREPLTAQSAATAKAAKSVEVLQAIVDSDPDDYAIRRRLGEALLDAGDREGGLRELETAMLGFERADNLNTASSLVDEIVRLNPDSVRHHQKRVEYAFRRNERGTLIEAYLQLADALFRAGMLDKSRAIYQRVLDLAPDDPRVQAALEAFPAPEAPPAPAHAAKAAARGSEPAAVAAGGDDEFVNLGDWLRGDDAKKNTRMVVQEQEPSGDEEADFQDMLQKFKQGIAENIEDEDHQSHYDLGVAYKEMGLLDEAIAEFQKALRAPTNRVPTYEALGQSFMEKGQYPMAATILSRALNEKGVTDDQLVGVLYLLGRCAEERGQQDAAVEYYHRVFVVDIQFRDVNERLVALEGARR